MRMTAENIVFAEMAPWGLLGVPTYAEAPSDERAAEHREGDVSYYFGGGSSPDRMVSHEKERGAASFASSRGKTHREACKRKKASGGSRPVKDRRTDCVHAALEAAKACVLDGFTWTAKISLDAGRSIQDERFRSRLAQLAYDSTGEAAFASRISRALNSYAAESRVPRSDNPSPMGGEARFGIAVAELVARKMITSELERRGHRYVASDDGIVVFLKSEAAATRVSESMGRYLEHVLHGFVDAWVAKACKASETSIFGFCIILEQEHPRVCIHESLLKRMKAALRHATARSRGVALSQRLREVAAIVAWGNGLMALADDARCVVAELNEWLASRFRVVLWKNWKLVRSRIGGLEAAGVPHERAVMLGGSHAGFWAAAVSDGLKQALSYAVLRRMGFSFFLVETAV